MSNTMDWSNSERVALWMAARPTRNPIMESLRDSFDGGDPWGSVMGAWFAVADAITEIDPALVPTDWDFRQSPMGSNTESYEYQAIMEAMADGAVLEDLEHCGKVLTRYAAQLKLAGLDY